MISDSTQWPWAEICKHSVNFLEKNIFKSAFLFEWCIPPRVFSSLKKLLTSFRYWICYSISLKTPFHLHNRLLRYRYKVYALLHRCSYHVIGALCGGFPKELYRARRFIDCSNGRWDRPDDLLGPSRDTQARPGGSPARFLRRNFVP